MYRKNESLQSTRAVARNIRENFVEAERLGMTISADTYRVIDAIIAKCTERLEEMGRAGRRL